MINHQKLKGYFGKKSESLYIQNYWAPGKGHVTIETSPVNINFPSGQRQFESLLNQVVINGATLVCINGADFSILELLPESGLR